MNHKKCKESEVYHYGDEFHSVNDGGDIVANLISVGFLVLCGIGIFHFLKWFFNLISHIL